MLYVLNSSKIVTMEVSFDFWEQEIITKTQIKEVSALLYLTGILFFLTKKPPHFQGVYIESTMINIFSLFYKCSRSTLINFLSRLPT